MIYFIDVKLINSQFGHKITKNFATNQNFPNFY